MRARERTYELASAGRSLLVRADGSLAAQWGKVAPHLPGVAPGDLRPGAGPAAVRLPDGAEAGDARRLLNAHLHLLHLAHGTLCAHAVALRHPERGWAVVLLGGHGAGKTLVALALARRGWQIRAGDVTLLDCSGHPLVPRVLGGTSAFLARREPTRRWFPDLPLPKAGAHRADLAVLLGLPTPEPGAAPEPVPVTAALTVDVDGDRQARHAAVEALDAHTAATVWWRASGHLLERLLDHSDLVLRRLETDPDAARRLARVRALADHLPLHAVWGTPEAIADQAEHLTHTPLRNTTAEEGGCR
ncbi:hypothetical protein ACGRHY_27650 [Streptomyces sp. HK10]|uniref:hypothetical protein n=1 Tax=Streptomyces sp. HK10 TaxID=3373255 RepID=UPI0037491B2A